MNFENCLQDVKNTCTYVEGMGVRKGH